MPAGNLTGILINEMWISNDTTLINVASVQCQQCQLLEPSPGAAYVECVIKCRGLCGQRNWTSIRVNESCLAVHPRNMKAIPLSQSLTAAYPSFQLKEEGVIFFWIFCRPF